MRNQRQLLFKVSLASLAFLFCALLAAISFASVLHGYYSPPLKDSFHWPADFIARPSALRGQGLFALRDFNQNQPLGIVIASWRGLPFITPAVGRYVNHCEGPYANAKLEEDTGFCCRELETAKGKCQSCGLCCGAHKEVLHEAKVSVLVAQRDIKAGEEITVDYETAPWFISGPRTDFVSCGPKQ